ncbi:MAG: MATE family efflux transporter [Anaeroplasmataceae bacterium]|nr:MATE family efflux transporter [Anaeroplasmataceae bacterium]
MIRLFDTQRLVKDADKQGEIPKYSKVTKDVMKIVWPSMVEGFLVALVTMFDGIMVSTIGNDANSAVTITKQPIYFMICFITALNIALTAIVSRRFGAKNQEPVNITLHEVVKLCFGISVVLSILVACLARPLCQFMGATSNTIDYATTYLTIIASGFIFNGLRLTINACQRGIGKTKISMWTNLVANVVNIGLNYLLIEGHWGFPRLGIGGAAIATVIGNAVAFLICLVTILLPKGYLKLQFKQLFKLDKDTLKDIGHILPSCFIDQIFMRIGFILFALIVNYLGDDATYVHGICNDLNSLMFTLADGFSIGTAAIVGHRLGEKRKDLAIVYAKVSMTISLFCAIITCIFMFSARDLLISMYKPETKERAHMASIIMIIAAFTTLPQNIQWVITGILRGSGDTKFTATSSLVSVTCIRPLVSYLLCYPIGLGVMGAWIGMLIDQALRMGLNIWRFSQKKWLQIQV